MKIALLLLAALLAMAAAQTTSPAASGSPNASASGSPAASPSSPAAASGSQFANCDTLLLNGTGNFDILLLGSESPSVSGSPAASASGSPAASRSPGVSASPSLVNASPSLSRSPSASAAAASPASSPSAAATASASPIISPSANTRLLDLASSLVGGRLAVNGNARVSNSILGGGLACLTSASPAASGSAAASASGSPAASISGSPASSAAAATRSPSASISGSPASSAAAATRSPSASISGSPASSAAAATRSPSASISGSPASSAAATRSPSASGSPAASPDLALLVTGNLEITNAQLACGGLAVGGSVSGSPLLSQTNAQNLEGSQALAAANSLDFASLRQRLLADSDELCSLSSTGQLSLNEFGGAVLDASLSSSNVTDSGASSDNSSNVAIFNLPSSALANLTSLLINGTSANGFVIINIIDESGSAASSGSDTGTSGTTSSSSNNLTLSEFSTDAGNLNGTQLLWNFCNASRIDISNILLQGTILAPRASVSVNRAELEGALIAQSLIGNFFNHIPLRYQGVFCPAGSQSASASPSASPAAQASASPSA